MRLVFALAGSRRDSNLLNAEAPKNVLVSFASAKKVEELAHTPEFLIIDSGAFSAWNSGRSVDLEEYARFARGVLSRFPRVICVNLDVIPGTPGKTSTAAERSVGMAQSIENADRLRALGLPIMEVFHQDEPLGFLDQLLRRLPSGGMLGLSPRNDLTEPARVKWLEGVLRHLLSHHRLTPKNLPRCHGLAATAAGVMEAFPFYSVDSTTWITSFKWGMELRKDGRRQPIAGGILPSSRYQPGLMYVGRQNIRTLLEMERRITMLWARRGVEWRE